MSPREVVMQVLRQGTPLAVGMSAHALFNLVDLLLVAGSAVAAVAGAHVATVVNFLPMVFGNGVSVAVLARLSLLLGAGRLEEARGLSSRSQKLMLLLGLFFAVVGTLTAGPCVALQGLTGTAEDIGFHYLVVSQLGCVTMFALMQTTVSMRAVGEGSTALGLLVGTNLLNLGLALVLIFGWDAIAMPAFGAPGAAYATVIARGVGALLGFLWLARSAHPLRFTLSPPPGPRREWVGFLLNGLPQSCQMLVRASLVIMMTRLASDLAGEAAVTALGVTTRLDTVVLFGASGFGSAATVLCGKSLGAGDEVQARRVARAGRGVRVRDSRWSSSA
jgi:Na+-driven multidrug efflux pump